MKITLYERPIDGGVWKWAKDRAKRDRVSLSRVVVDALRLMRTEEEARTDAAR
jgi:hypothetical protein